MTESGTRRLQAAARIARTDVKSGRAKRNTKKKQAKSIDTEGQSKTRLRRDTANERFQDKA